MSFLYRNATSLFFAVLIVLLLTASVVSFFNIRDLGNTAKQVNHNNVISQKLLEVLSLIKDAESTQRGYIITKNSDYLNSLNNYPARLEKIYQELDSLLSNNNAQTAELIKLKILIQERLSLAKKTLEIASTNNQGKLIEAVEKGKVKMDETRVQIEKMIQVEKNLLLNHITKNNRNLKFTPIFALVISMISIVLISIVFVRAREESYLKEDAINALKNKNEDLKKQQEFVDAIFDASVDVISYLDNNLIFRKFNYAGVAMYGKSKEELIGKNFVEQYPHIKTTGLYNDLQKALSGELIHQTEYYSPPTKKYFELFLVPLKNKDEQVEGIIMIAHNITEIVSAKNKLLLQNLQLEQSNQELTSFSYIASHDLKEPLRKIQIYCKRISEANELGEKQQGYFDKIISATERMQSLIDSLLNFSMANNSEIKFEPCDLNIILKQTIYDLEEKIKEKQAIIHFDKMPVISGIYNQLIQLFTNLIENSIKYCKPDVQPVINISCALIHGSVIPSPMAQKTIEYFQIEVKDNGIGFEQDYEQKIFEIFQRLHPRHQFSGTGIGLAICKKITQNHNGIIVAQGIPNKGATFRLYFPVVNS